MSGRGGVRGLAKAGIEVLEVDIEYEFVVRCKRSL
jgi:hypothetical protein